MAADSIAQQLAQVRSQLDRACERLTSPSPEGLDQCSYDLESAMQQLAACQPQFSAQAGNAEALAEAWHVRRSFQRARRLMDSAAVFHDNWMRLRGVMSGGYTPTGDPGPVLHPSRICLQA
jgi:hypothetical protein